MKTERSSFCFATGFQMRELCAEIALARIGANVTVDV